MEKLCTNDDAPSGSTRIWILTAVQRRSCTVDLYPYNVFNLYQISLRDIPLSEYLTEAPKDCIACISNI
jgi:hypothetical protein